MSTEEKELIDFANFIKEKKLETPVLLLIESHKPVFRLVHASLLIFEPLLFFIAKSKKWELLKKVLEDKVLADKLISLL